MASMAKKILLPNSVAIVEAMAAVKALTFAQDIGLSYFILEGDSEIVINVLKNKDKAKTLSFGGATLLLVVYGSFNL